MQTSPRIISRLCSPRDLPARRRFPEKHRAQLGRPHPLETAAKLCSGRLCFWLLGRVQQLHPVVQLSCTSQAFQEKQLKKIPEPPTGAGQDLADLGFPGNMKRTSRNPWQDRGVMDTHSGVGE
ncbi:hypothetical protein Y1Q_0011112 [Alligator mississippiensis]|uniref:Uncharacterized protein n=1 Tax=Alligator mississippiensis TaxID=8496 RepID=A0A151PJJ7_ALLMI|nr:hypothetical protein Y1Q_0011112 [Alligator mississippiensis]